MDAVTSGTEPPRISGEGNAESDWAHSKWLQNLPLINATAWLSKVRRLVVVSPHPDDEVLGCGALIHLARRMRIDVKVISVTDGEACYPGSRHWTRDSLRDARRKELLAALDCLGVSRDCAEMLDLGDGRVADHEAALSSLLCGMLQPEDSVLTTWSGDGHPDHEATARGVLHAATQCGAAVFQFPVWAWHWLSPIDRHPDFGAAAKLRLTDDARDAKQKALACFASQLDSGDESVEPILPPRVLQRFGRSFEVLIA